MTADTFNACMIVGALRIVCNGLCTASRFHTAEENSGYLPGCHEGIDCIRHYNRCPTFLIPYVLCGLTPTKARYPRRSAVRSDRCAYWLLCSLMLSPQLRTDRLCILVARLIFSLPSQLTTYREPTVDRLSTFVSLCMGKSL